ncbi:hypothetical protein HHK36_009866 [Tetracentron sinense]|uniref:C2 domain-containing protein n=2 Tax=Magnoliopsida TaxID=3398 RepID=A0A835DIR0_TETSI|nr:hypothetical protein HHK36_009866 [Tetracentron sinense]
MYQYPVQPSMSISGIQGQLLEVTVVEGNKLKDTEWFSRQDPYVCLEYSGNKFRTRTCTDGGKNPTFREKFYITLIEGHRELNLLVWNSNTFSPDTFIGSGKVQLQKVLSQGYDDTAWPLQSKCGRHAGEVRLILHYANAQQATRSSAPSQVPQFSAPPPPCAASYPPPSHYPSYPPNSAAYPPPPYLPPQPAAYPPQPYPPPPQASNFYQPDFRGEKKRISIFEKKKRSVSMYNQYPVQQSMSISGIQGQLLEVTVVGCNKLKDTEWISRQDPYVCLEYSSNKVRTRTCTDGGKNPIFQEKFVFTLIEGLRELNIVVWNSNTLSYDDFIGNGKVQLQKVLSQGFDDTAWPIQSKSGRHAGEVRLILHYANAQKGATSFAPSVSPYGTPAVSRVAQFTASSQSSASPYPPQPSASPYPPQPSAFASPYSPQPSASPYPPATAYPTPSPYPSYLPKSAAYPASPYPPPQPDAYPPQPYPPTTYPPQPYPPPPQSSNYYPPGPYPGIYPPPPY